MGRNVLFDPATGDEYAWEVNHARVEKAERTRAIAETVGTGAGWLDGIRPVLQQGEATPEVLRVAGRFWHDAQRDALARFFRASKTRTLIFTEHSGEQYEVLVNAHEPQRKAVVRSPNGGRYVWDYSFEMQVVNQLN